MFTKIIDASTLNAGISIPVDVQPFLYEHLGFKLKRGEQRYIRILLQGCEYDDAVIKNELFDSIKYPERQDIVQIRYPKNSLLAKKLRTIFSHTNNIIEDYNAVPTKPYHRLVIPEDEREYIDLYIDNGLLRFDCVTHRNEEADRTVVDNEESLSQKQDFDSTKPCSKPEIVKVIIKSTSGYGSIYEAYQDTLTITPDSMSYICTPKFSGESVFRAVAKWKYQTNNPRFREMFVCVSEMIADVIGNGINVFAFDTGEISFKVVFKDRTCRKDSYFIDCSYFETIFSVIRRFVPAYEPMPAVLETEDYLDEEDDESYEDDEE